MHETEHRGFSDPDDDTECISDTDVMAVIDRFNAAWADHDLDLALSMLSEDCLFDATGPAPDGARCVGREAIREAWAPIFDDPVSSFAVEDTIVVGERVVQLWRYEWREGHIRGVDVYRVVGDQIAEKRSYVKG